MANSTQTDTTPDTPRGYGFCSWHHRFAADVRLIEVNEQGSGVHGAQYACAPCRKQHNLTPFADR